MLPLGGFPQAMRGRITASAGLRSVCGCACDLVSAAALLVWLALIQPERGGVAGRRWAVWRLGDATRGALVFARTVFAVAGTCSPSRDARDRPFSLVTV